MQAKQAIPPLRSPPQRSPPRTHPSTQRTLDAVAFELDHLSRAHLGDEDVVVHRPHAACTWQRGNKGMRVHGWQRQGRQLAHVSASARFCQGSWAGHQSGAMHLLHAACHKGEAERLRSALPRLAASSHRARRRRRAGAPRPAAADPATHLAPALLARRQSGRRSRPAFRCPGAATAQAQRHGGGGAGWRGRPPLMPPPSPHSTAPERCVLMLAIS